MTGNAFCRLALGLLLVTGLLGLSVPARAQKQGVLPPVRALVVPHEETLLSAQIGGRIAALSIRPGESFREGDPLFALDCRLYQAQWERARIEMTHTGRAWAMSRRLAELGSGSRYERNQAEGAAARAAADGAQLALTLEMCTVKAPFDGRVVDRKAQPQQVVSPGQAVLEVYGTARYDVQLLVPSLWVAWLRPGKPFRLHLDETGREYDASVTEIGARIDPASQSVKVFGRLDAEAGDVLSGMSGTALFDGAASPRTTEAPVPVVPVDAVAHPVWTIGH